MGWWSDKVRESNDWDAAENDASGTIVDLLNDTRALASRCASLESRLVDVELERENYGQALRQALARLAAAEQQVVALGYRVSTLESLLEQ